MRQSIGIHAVSGRNFAGWVRTASVLLLAAVTAALSGCGAGGYIGGGISSLSVSAFSLDSGQSYQIQAGMTTGNLNVVWGISGATCSGSSCGTLTQTGSTSAIYTAPTGVTAPLAVTVTATVPNTSTMKTVSVTVNPAITIQGVPPSGTVGKPYTATITTSGGTAPVTLSANASSLPPGLTFNAATGVISGTPTQSGEFTFTVQATDTSIVPATATAQEIISIGTVGQALVVLNGNPPAGTVGTSYSYALQATGGVSPYAWSVPAGALPPGLTLNSSNGLISGTPTTAGTFTFTAQAKDAAGTTASSNFTITISSTGTLMLTTGTLPAGTVNVPYNATIGVSGGTGPYSCSVPTGSLPSGLTLTASGCVVSGTPKTAGTVTLSVTATDSSNPAKTVTGPVSLTINPAATPNLVITTGTLPNGTVNVAYNAAIGVSGGTGPYSCTVPAGTLPAGLTLTSAGCVISGTPTTAGSVTLSVTATDSSNPAKTVTSPVGLTINPASTPNLVITTGTLPNGTVNTAYNATIGVSGGTGPYSCTVPAGTLPAGLTLTSAGCVISGTPTTAGSVTLSVTATDSSNPAKTVTSPVGLTINPAASPNLVINTGTLPNGTVNTAYNATISVSGGTGPYSCTVPAGTLPAGLTLTSAGCVVSGTPTTAGSVTLSVTATDSSNPAKTVTSPVGLTINPAATPNLVITTGTLPNGTVNTAYNATIGVSGGTGPYSCTVPAGTLPAGLTLTSAGCVVSGTPTTAGSVTLSVTATDSSNPAKTVTSPVGLTINPSNTKLSLTGTLPNGVVGTAYSQTIAATGGMAPYTYVVSAGALPAGLSLSSTGVISGTPTTPGASSFTVTVTDSENPTQSTSNNYVILVTYPVTPNSGKLVGPYAFLFQGYDDAIAGVASYKTATVGSFTADGMGGISLGELDTNHQTSTANGTLPSRKFVGTYTIGADNRGTLTLTTLRADGTTAATNTYAIAVKAPVAPATVVTQGSFIESDSNQLAGTKGSGSFFQQTSAAVTAGLTGGYVFGMSGDTPCLLSCNASLLTPGPVAAVGEFTTSNGAIVGTGDSNVATSTLASANLTGSYGAPDSNGRVALSLVTNGEPGPYPTNYAVYTIDGTQAFIISTDPHNSYALLAGSMQARAQSFSNASITGNFVGYENAATNPGLVNATLSTTLNYSTATIFQATGAANGTCSINVVTTGGVDSLVTALTNVGGNVTTITQALTGYSSTGATTCATSSIGRGTLQYPVVLNVLGVQVGTPPAPRVYYLSAANKGYFLETSYAAVGNLEPQTGAPFTLSNTFNGTYVAASTTASSAASINTSGIFVTNGAGTLNYTEDLNVGAGTINVIQLGTTGTGTYTAPNAYGQIFFSTYVLYAITPNRLVMVDTNKLTTSPSVILLY